MEALMQVIGILALVLMVAVGALAGWVASLTTDGHRLRYVLIGVAAAVAAPFIAAALGIAALLAYGLAAVLVVALIGAALVLTIVRLILD